MTTDGFKRRTPVEAQVDVQASYSINVAGSRRVTLLADAFNIFNLRRTLDYNAAVEYPGFGVDNPDFGTPTSAIIAGQQFQQPFALRLGARFEFLVAPRLRYFWGPRPRGPFLFLVRYGRSGRWLLSQLLFLAPRRCPHLASEQERRDLSPVRLAPSSICGPPHLIVNRRHAAAET
jgi:hypothetical protein